MTFSPQRCLVVGPSWVGDMVMAQSLFMILCERFPQLHIDVLAPAWSKPVLAAMPEVRDALEMPLQHGELGLRKRYQLGKSLRECHYDWSITLPGSLKSALVPFWAQIPVRTGFRGEMRYGLLNDMRLLDKSRLPMTVQRFVALGLPADAAQPPAVTNPAMQVAQSEQQQARDKFQLGTAPLLALCPGAEYGPSKRWPVEYFSAVAQHFVEQQHGQVVLLGSGKDAPVCAEIAKRAALEACYDLAGQTSLAEVLALLATADHVVSNDSGLMHLAAAVGSHVIALYGSTDPSHTPPLSPQADILYQQLDCSPCFKRECPLQHLDCLQKITPEQVITRL